MKRTVNKSTCSTGKLKPHSEISTGVTSQQRSKVHSLIRRETKQSKDECTVKAKQLFSIIETFYSTLCDLPLEKLINSAQPQMWIEEQEETVRSLQSRLTKVGRGKEQEYYRCKLRSIETILSNIRNNLAMLQRLTELKNYCSSSSSQSHCGSSFDQSAKGIRLGHLASDANSIQEMKEMLSYDDYPIESSQVPKSTTSGCAEIMAQTVNSEVQQSEEEDEEEYLARSQMLSKQQKRAVPRESQNRNNSNKYVEESTRVDLKDKTLAKVQTSSKSQRMNNTSTENWRGKLHNQQTKRSQTIVENSSCFTQSVPNQYLDLIKELRVTIMEKDREIERLLINEQQFDETVEIYQTRQKEKSTEILFLKENASINERERQKMHQEITRLNAEADELRETVKVERDRWRREEAERLKAEERIEREEQESAALRSEVERLKKECQNARNSQRSMKETLDVYTRKYFQLQETMQNLKEESYAVELQLQRERERNSSAELCEAVRRIAQRHKQKIFLSS